MSVLSNLVEHMPLPRVVEIQQHFARPKVQDVRAGVEMAVRESGVLKRIQPGWSVAIAAGSRGVANAPVILRELVRLVRDRGGEPFLVPAMGSHGGATAQGQMEVLERLGITEEICGCPICSDMETVLAGTTRQKGLPVYLDRFAAAADAIILFNRIKPHTSFRGPVESGLCKLAVIGLGKQKGAELCHSFSMKDMSENILEISGSLLDQGRILCGVGVLENAYDETAKIVCLQANEIQQQEPKLLQEAFSLLPAIPFPRYDILVLDEIGKEISGTGMDCNIVSRYTTDAIPPDPRQKVVAVLRLSEQTHGNAHGMGLADIATKKFMDNIDFTSTYANPLTALSQRSFQMPMILDDDRTVLKAAVKLCVGSDPEQIRLVRAKNTMQIDRLQISEALLEEARALPNIEVLSAPQALVFNSQGDLF